jgi:uncharacterized Zn finger protein (UPF0148 family)
MPRELSNLCLGIKSIAKLHLHDSVSYRTVARARYRANWNFVTKRDKNQDRNSEVCPECGGRIELRGDEYVCPSCGLVDEERSTVEGQARDIGLEIEAHEPSLRLDLEDDVGSGMTDLAIYRVVGEKVRQVSSLIHDDRRKLFSQRLLDRLVKGGKFGRAGDATIRFIGSYAIPNFMKALS